MAGARAGKGTAGARRQKDSNMAARMKGEKRTTARCPLCNQVVSLAHLENIMTCKHVRRKK